VQALKEMVATYVRLAASIEFNNQQQGLTIQQEALKNHNKDASKSCVFPLHLVGTKFGTEVGGGYIS
jgi:hypothetical protein